jgi:hypothetical protein
VILAGLMLAQAVVVPKLLEFPVATDELVAIEAVIRLPKLEVGHRYRLDQAALNAVKMTPQYGRRDISRILSPGYRFRIDQLADALRIGLTVDPKDLGAGLSVLSSVLTEPTFLPDAIKVDKLPESFPWRRALRSYDSAQMDISQESLRDVWKYVVQPNLVTIGVRGPFNPGSAKALWKDRERFWSDYQPNKTVSGRSPSPRLDIGEPPILLMSSEVPVLTTLDLVVATLMGGGKDSVLWSVCREQLRMSYQQGAYLLPTLTGWEYRLAIATDKSILDPEKVESLRARLHEGIEKLSQVDLAHANGLLRGYIAYGQPGIPILLGNSSVTGGDANDALFRDMYLSMKGVPPIDKTDWTVDVSVAEVKSHLHKLLDLAKVSYK